MEALERVLSKPIARLIEWVARATIEEIGSSLRHELDVERSSIRQYLDDPTLARDSQAAARLRGELTMCDVLERKLTRVSPTATLARVILRVETAVDKLQKR